MVEQVRRFNRTVTQRVGALDDHFLARDRPLAEARVLWEIGADGCEVRALRARLGLDSGHASRLLRALEADGMVRVEAGERDRRVRVARLTAAGLAELAVLDRRSEALAESLLAPLAPEQRERLVGAMRDVERLLTAAMVEIRAVDPEHPDARQCLRSYFAELERRSGAPFDPLIGSTAEPHELRPPAGEMVVAYLRAEAVALRRAQALRRRRHATSSACGSPTRRAGSGSGAGCSPTSSGARRARARAPCGSRRATSLVEAIALYRSAGYREVPAFNDEPFAHHWFEKRLS